MLDAAQEVECRIKNRTDIKVIMNDPRMTTCDPMIRLVFGPDPIDFNKTDVLRLRPKKS